MILFGIMGLAGLVIDIGIARLTQRQMKQATDASALESLHKSDVEISSPRVFVGRTAATEAGRRQSAADMVTVLFGDDFDSLSDTRNFGAGPQLNLTGGIELQDGFAASQDLSLPAQVVYKPALQLNAGNDPDGDVFTSVDEVTVRLQRDNSADIPGVSSNGGSVPFLFARGTLMASNRKAAGIQLDVSSSAETRPVVRVGVQQTVGGVTIPGGIAFGISRAVWEALPSNMPTTILLTDGSVGVTPTVVREIGADIGVLPIAPSGDGYCPVFENISGNMRVIGFGWVQIEPDPVISNGVRITKHRDTSTTETVAAENATARISEAWDSLNLLNVTDREAVINSNRSFADPLVSAVLTAGG